MRESTVKKEIRSFIPKCLPKVWDMKRQGEPWFMHPGYLICPYEHWSLKLLPQMFTAFGEEGMNWENDIDMYTLSCVKQTASGKVLNSTGSSARGSVTTLRGEMEGGREGGSRGSGYMYTRSWFGLWRAEVTQHCKTIIIQLKIKMIINGKHENSKFISFRKPALFDWFGSII